MALSEADEMVILGWARLHPEIEAVWLFGSRARGDHRPDSDIDLAVMTPTELDWIDNRRRYEEGLSGLSCKPHLNWYRPEVDDLPTLTNAIKDEGLLIYRR